MQINTLSCVKRVLFKEEKKKLRSQPAPTNNFTRLMNCPFVVG